VQTPMLNDQYKKPIVDRIYPLVKQVSESFGLSVLDIRFGQQGSRKTLEICIVRRGGEPVSLADCEKVSRALEGRLEEEFIKSDSFDKGPVLLEVVSPGIERQLTTELEFELFAGQQVRIRAKEKIFDLGCDFICVLLGARNGFLRLAIPRPLFVGQAKVAKSKGAKPKSPGKEDRLTNSAFDGATFELDLARVFKINLHPYQPKAK